MTQILHDLKNDLQRLYNPEKAKFLLRFFKTGKGEYGEGDVFLGLTVPESRKLAQKYKNLSFEEIKRLLASKFHEERLIALLILVHNFNKGSQEVKKEIFDFYLSSTKFINNWDLVDLSADKIVGEYLYMREKDEGGRGKKERVLTTLARSENLWERRIAMVATYAFIKRGESELALEIAEILINDKHDLLQKAVGWMLREVGKRCSEKDEEEFLKKYYKTMPRTALRYAIERFPEEKRKAYLTGTIG